VGAGRSCSHPRLYGYPGQYSTMEAHMPPDHQAYVQWNADRFIAWARKIGPNTETTVKAILSSHKVEHQGYKSCLSLIKLADKYSVVRLEAACKKALFYTPMPSYKSVKTILPTGQDKIYHIHNGILEPFRQGITPAHRERHLCNRKSRKNLLFPVKSFS